MRKLFIALVAILISIYAYKIIINGYSIGRLNVLSVSEIQKNSENLNSSIENVEKLKKTTFMNAMNDLNNVSKELLKQKKTYDELILYSKESDIEKANQSQKYDIQFLWTKVGTYATQNGVKLVFDVIEKSEDTEKKIKMCDLRFTITGSYISITDFIADLEKDAKLSFTIEDFTMNPSDSNLNLQSTFRVNDIAVNSESTSLLKQKTEETKNKATNSSATPTPTASNNVKSTVNK